MVKNQVVFGRCIDYTYDGLGVVKYDTFTIFVKGLIVGESANIVITFVRKNFAYGKVLEIIEKSDKRVEQLCVSSKTCGGCQLLHMSAFEQANFKYNHVKNVINNIGKINHQIEPIISMTNPYCYRNKIILPVGLDKNNNLKVGFYRYNSHDIINIDNCLLQSDDSNKLVKKLKEFIVKHHLEKEIRYIFIRDMQKTQEMMLVFVTYNKNVDLSNICKDVLLYQPQIKCIMQNINSDLNTNVILSKNERLLYGNEYITDKLCGLDFRISSHSFYQVNTYQTEILYKKAIELAELNKDDVILDLYCGVGTIGIIASQYVKKVIGVEIVKEAVEDGNTNIKINDITNVELICDDAKNACKELKKQNISFDCLFIDPPRKGCSSEALETIVNFDSKKIVYISCNPSTLARDLNYLKDYYDIQTIQPVDMFPNTYHVETVVLMSRDKE